MRRSILLIPLLIALTACGGGDSSPDDAGPSGGDAPRTEATATAATSRGETGGDSGDTQEVLLRAARNSAEVESMRGSFDMSIDFGGFDMSFDGEMAFRAPDQMHMTMSMFAQDFEMLVYGSNFYMNTGDGWRSVDLSGAGINLDQFDQLWENRGLFNVEQLAESFGDNITQLDDASIGGEVYEHYHVELDPSEIANNVPEGLFDEELLAQVGSALDTLESDVYIDPATDLVRRVTVSVSMEIPQGGEGSVAMTMDMLEYNGDVEIPAEPAGAPPLDPADLGPTT